MDNISDYLETGSMWMDAVIGFEGFNPFWDPE